MTQSPRNKVLIITGLPFRNDWNLGKTLCTLFSMFQPEEIAQMYFSPQTPNVKSCYTYYQLNEKQLIKSVFGVLTNKCGRIFSSEDINDNYKMAESNPRAIVSLRHHIIIPILRDLLWCVSHWKSRKMKHWLDEVSPNVIFCIMPGSIKSSRIIDFASSYCKCKVVMFVTDDYYNISETNPGVLRRWYYLLLQKSIDKMTKNVKYVLGCSELAAEEFGKKYGVPYEAIYTPSAQDFLNMPEHLQTEKKPVVFRYFGNLGLERWKPLAELGKAIASYNSGEQKAILEVYSNLMYPDAIAQLDIPNGCEFKGWVHGEEFMRFLQDADVAVHVESFSEEMCRRTRLSISTKIADYLGAGKCILAIGRDDLASIQHIEEVAFTCHNLLSLEKTVRDIVENPSKRMYYSKMARQLSIEAHDQNIIAQRMKSLLSSEI